MEGHLQEREPPRTEGAWCYGEDGKVEVAEQGGGRSGGEVGSESRGGHAESLL